MRLLFLVTMPHQSTEHLALALAPDIPICPQSVREISSLIKIDSLSNSLSLDSLASPSLD